MHSSTCFYHRRALRSGMTEWAIIFSFRHGRFPFTLINTCTDAPTGSSANLASRISKWRLLNFQSIWLVWATHLDATYCLPADYIERVVDAKHISTNTSGKLSMDASTTWQSSIPRSKKRWKYVSWQNWNRTKSCHFISPLIDWK